MRQFPNLGVFPGNVDCVVEVQQQSFTSVEKTQTEKIVVNEGQAGPQRDVDHAESGTPLGHGHLRSQRRVAVHVVDVIGNRGVRMMQDRAAHLEWRFAP